MQRNVSLCMIVKNEEKNLPRCLESVKDIVDEMIIVDTGSSDSTVEIAKSYGAKIINYRWDNNFSEARNESLKHATGYWIMLMDADDEFCREDKDKLMDIINHADGEVYFLETHSYVGNRPGTDITVNLNLRLLKNNTGYYFSNAIHEQLMNEKYDKMPGAKLPVNIGDIKVYHYGYLSENIILKNKRVRNTEIIKKQILEEPTNPFHYFNLGSEYFADNNFKSALDAYNVVYKNFDPYTGFSSKMLVRMILCHFYIDNFEEALKLISDSLEYYPLMTDIEYLRGMVYYRQNRFTIAIRSFEKCMQMGEPPSELKFIGGVGTYRVYDVLTNIYMQMKDYDRAYEYAVKMLQSRPDYIQSLYNIAHILTEQKTPIADFKKNIEVFFSNLPAQIPFISDLFYLEGYYDVAFEYLEKYESAFKVMPEHLIYFKCKCLIALSRYEECMEQVSRLNINDPYYFDASMHRILCLIILGKPDTAFELIENFKKNRDSLTQFNRKRLASYELLLNLSKGKLSKIKLDSEHINSLFEIVEILFINKERYTMGLVLKLLNTSSDKMIHLRLGKLYYKYGYKKESKEELIKSIKLSDVMNKEVFQILEEIF